MVSAHSRRPQLNQEFRQIMALVCESIPEFRHYDVRKIAVSIGASKGRGRHGVWAHVIPLRYVGGRAERKGRRFGIAGVYAYESPQIQSVQPEAAYLMTFLVPRFFVLSPQERLETIVHELYHVHPTLRGDLRRFNAPHVHHGPTPALFERKVKSLTQEALRAMPELLKHPLLQSDGSHYTGHVRVRLPRPRRVFRPAPWPAGLREWASRLFVPLLCCVAAAVAGAAQAVTVRAIKQGSLYEKPSARSTATGNFSPGSQFEAVRLSPNRTWVEVRGDAAQGWVPRAWVETLKATTKGDGDADLGQESLPEGAGAGAASAEQGLQEFDARSDKFFTKQGGRLYEKPSALSARFGMVEKDDELRVLGHSPEKQWTQVRLLITGEEGWYPSKWIRRVQEQRLKALPRGGAEAGLGVATKDHGWGLTTGYVYNLLPGGLESRPRDRLEVGGALSYWLGVDRSPSSGAALSTKAWALAAFGRYVGVSNDGRFFGGAELGLQFHKPSFTQTGVTNATLLADLAKFSQSSIGVLGGLFGGYAITEEWQMLLATRVHVSGAPFAYLFVGGAYRF